MTPAGGTSILRFGRRSRGGPDETATMCSAFPDCVLLADRHHRLSDGVRGLLETVFGGVFMVADQASLMEGAERLSPAVVVADVALAGGDLAEFLRALRARAPMAKVLLLSAHDEPSVAKAALTAGADGLVLKRAIGTDLLPAIDALRAGRRYVSAAAER